MVIVKSNKGFSLIEMTIALFILAFSLLGFISVMATSIDSNLQNEIRNTAIGLTAQIADILLTQDFDELDANDDCSLTPDNYDENNICLVPDFTHYPNPAVTIRKFQQTYTVNWIIIDVNSNLKQIEINTDYMYRGQGFSHDIVTYKHRNI